MTTTEPRPALVTGPGRDCPLCGWPARTTSPIEDRYGWTWSLSVCGACGAEYQARPMTDSARRDFYASGLYRRLAAEATGKPWDDQKYLRREQRDYADRWRVAPMMSIPSGGQWLDYGGSTGVVAAAFAEVFSPKHVVVADYGDGATTTPEAALAVDDGTYDAILCCQTLDHLPDPLDTLREFRRVAKPGARLFVDVVKREHTKLKLDHEWYPPTASCFLALIERAGWVPLWLDGETNPTHWSVLAWR